MVIDKAWDAIGKPSAAQLPASIAKQNRMEQEWRRQEQEHKGSRRPSTSEDNKHHVVRRPKNGNGKKTREE